MSDLEQRLSQLKHRLRTAYDGIGHSHGRPYVYVVYPPAQERALRRLQIFLRKVRRMRIKP